MPVLIKIYTIYSAVLKILARRFFCLLKEVGNVDIIRTENKFSGGFMYYSAGTYEAFAHPEKPKDVDKNQLISLARDLPDLRQPSIL